MATTDGSEACSGTTLRPRHQRPLLPPLATLLGWPHRQTASQDILGSTGVAQDRRGASLQNENHKPHVETATSSSLWCPYRGPESRPYTSIEESGTRRRRDLVAEYLWRCTSRKRFTTSTALEYIRTRGRTASPILHPSSHHQTSDRGFFKFPRGRNSRQSQYHEAQRDHATPEEPYSSHGPARPRRSDPPATECWATLPARTRLNDSCPLSTPRPRARFGYLWVWQDIGSHPTRPQVTQKIRKRKEEKSTGSSGGL
ncbi:hypothetical protein LX36DRAFT_738451 [Colletotrichum falcatum]|nr:hypothetical protein LX36DRAFT_738451 [Colletotrichum falcatum]